MEDEPTKKTEETEFTFERLSKELGSFLKFQKMMFILGSVVMFISAMCIVEYIILAKTLEHRCKIDSCDLNSTKYEKDFLNFTTYWDNQRHRWSRCYSYRQSGHGSSSENNSCASTSFDLSRQESCNEWIYDDSLMESTAATEFNLVCDKKWLQPFAGSSFMLGMLLGAIILGSVNDRFGRKIGMMSSVCILILGGILGAISNVYLVFLIARVLVGIGSVAMFQAAFVIVMEFAETKWRGFFGILIEIPFAFGEAFVAILAYYIRNWRYLELACVLPALFIFSYWWILPESIRWLVANKKPEKAVEVVRKIARMNDVEISEETIDGLMREGSGESAIVCPDEKSGRNLFDFYKYPNMRKRTFNLIFCWMVCALTYFGLSANSVNLSGDFFTNFALVMLVEIPSYIFSYYSLDRLGRKGTLSLTLFTGGVACLAAAFLPKRLYWLIVTLSMIGKFGVAAAFAIIFVYTTELYPTECRSVGLGTCSMAARIGGILAPFIAGLSEIYEPFPLLVFAIMAISSSILIIDLPETSGFEMQQTLEESEVFGRDQPCFYFPCLQKQKPSDTKEGVA